MVEQRVSHDVNPDGSEADTIDEIVTDGLHLEMLDGNAAYMTTAGFPDMMFNIRADPVSRAERRQRLREDQDRLVDHLGGLLPWRWTTDHPRACLWGIPVHRRPASAVRDWWTARRYAGVALTVTEER